MIETWPWLSISALKGAHEGKQRRVYSGSQAKRTRTRFKVMATNKEVTRNSVPGNHNLFLQHLSLFDFPCASRDRVSLLSRRCGVADIPTRCPCLELRRSITMLTVA